jgi:hypothetical protein
MGGERLKKKTNFYLAKIVDGDYFYNLNGVPINQRDRGYQLNNGWKHD